MNFELSTIKLNEAGDRFVLPEADEVLLRNTFNEQASNPELFKIKRLNNWDRGTLCIVVIALGALIYLASANKFFNNQTLSYSAIPVVALGILKVAYRQHCLSKCKEHLYVAFAIVSCRPHLGKINGINDFERFRNVARPLAIKDVYDGMHYMGQNDQMWDSCFNVKEFLKMSLKMRTKLSILSTINPLSERFTDVFREDDPAQHGRTFIQFLQQMGIEQPSVLEAN